MVGDFGSALRATWREHGLIMPDRFGLVKASLKINTDGFSTLDRLGLPGLSFWNDIRAGIPILASCPGAFRDSCIGSHVRGLLVDLLGIVPMAFV